MKLHEKIGLGTVQFGLKYGINNVGGIVHFDEVCSIIELYNLTSKFPLYDTAIGYGKSQEVLGKVFKQLRITEPQIVSKFSAKDAEGSNLRAALESTLTELNINRLYGFIAHDAKVLINNVYVFEILERLKMENKIFKIGVSVYSPSDLLWFIEHKYSIDLVQIPYSVFDQRFEGILELCKEKGIEVHSRSSFVQGLIFKDISFFNNYFSEYKSKMELLLNSAYEMKEKVEYLALTFSLMNKNIDRVIIGVDSTQNLRNNSDDAIRGEVREKLIEIKKELAITNESILLPYNWPINERNV